ncbi:copper transport protein ATOX1 isoform X1 [Pelmatolapia mariae]|uniref:copper transport protein ATOX1 isoform X1 n=1 Tax=Pelmatolapia mariae TaxID=158779 RepID=UPI002FE6BD7D
MSVHRVQEWCSMLFNVIYSCSCSEVTLNHNRGLLQLLCSAYFVKHEFEVAMTCEGCSGAITRILNKMGDVKFEIDLPKKLVWIESDKDVDVLMTALQKSGKEVKYNGTK